MGYKYILHIDDDEEDLEIFSTAVMELDTEIDCTSLNSSKEALTKLAAEELHPEIIFLDLNMPVIDGFQLLSKIKKMSNCTIPVIVLSTCSQPGTIDKVKQLGADGYIIKPNSIKEFVRVLTPFLG